MSKTRTTATVTFSAVLTLSEDEIRAFDALVGYGDDSFIGAFKEKLGAAYIRDHERGLKSAFQTIRRDLLPALRDIDQARLDLTKAAEERARSRAQGGMDKGVASDGDA